MYVQSKFYTREASQNQREKNTVAEEALQYGGRGAQAMAGAPS